MAVHRVSAKEWNANVDPNNYLKPFSGDIWKALGMIQKGQRVKIDALGNAERRRKQLHEYATRRNISVATRTTKDKKWIYACAVEKFGGDLSKYSKRLQSNPTKGVSDLAPKGCNSSRVAPLNSQEVACR